VPPLDPLPEFDLYAELDVAPDADTGAIERAWRAGVRSVHPDRARTGEERAATARTARLNIAREWLMDPSKRARYDLLRRPGPRVVLPDVDPLGSWPVRPRPRRPHWFTFLMRAIGVSLSIVAVTVIIGIGSNIATIVAFSFGLLTFVTFGLYAVVWVLVGAVYRRLG
jgi:hypothetical protein